MTEYDCAFISNPFFFAVKLLHVFSLFSLVNSLPFPWQNGLQVFPRFPWLTRLHVFPRFPRATRSIWTSSSCKLPIGLFLLISNLIIGYRRFSHWKSISLLKPLTWINSWHKRTVTVQISHNKNMNINKNAKYLKHTNSTLLKKSIFSVTFTYN